MPPFLKINDDLQIATAPGCLFISRSHKEIEYAESAVTAWVEANPDHARIEEAKRWLTFAEAKLTTLQKVRGLRAREGVIDKTAIRQIVREVLWANKVKFADLSRLVEEITAQIVLDLRDK